VTAASNAVFKLFFEAEMQLLLHLISLLKKTFKKNSKSGVPEAAPAAA
jgi:hypothetical protein